MLFAPRTLKNLFIFTLLASAVSLGVAYVAELGFGLKPCHLCLLQRIPYLLIIAMALLGLWKLPRATWLAVLIGIAFFVDSGIAAYHAATEKHWVAGPAGCTSDQSKSASVDDLLKQIEEAPIVLCDQAQWEYHGFTMANLNAFWALILATATFVALHQIQRRTKAHAQTPR